MADELRILLDINLLLDVLQKREPFYATSAGVVAAAEKGRIIGFIAAHSITTLFYLIQKSQGGTGARSSITNLLQILRIAPVDQETIEQALILVYADFEDAVQMMAAVRGRMDYLVTRNIRDFQPALLPVLQPVELLAVLG